MKNKLEQIVLIDDDQDDNYFHKIVLSEANISHEVKVFQSGFAAIDYLATATIVPDLIFLDINMPKMNGWEFLEKYKVICSHQNKKPVIIMLTTSLNPADKEKSENLFEMIGFETKPLSEEMLKNIFNRYFSDKAVETKNN